MTDQEIERLATKHIRWIKPEHGIFYDDEVLSFARAIIAAQHAAPERRERKAYICKACEGVYADQPVSQCDCMPEVDEFIEGKITYAAPQGEGK